MSNKTQLQTNNTKYASLIEILRGKAAGSGGSTSVGEWMLVSNLPTTLAAPTSRAAPGGEASTYYLALDSNVAGVMVIDMVTQYAFNVCCAYWKRKVTIVSGSQVISEILTIIGTHPALTITDLSANGTKNLQIDCSDVTAITNTYILPIYKPV